VVRERNSAQRLNVRLLEAAWPTAPSRSTALTRMERTSAITHLVSSLEFLARPADRRPGGLHNWVIAGRRFPTRSRALARAMNVVARPDVTTALHVARCAAALALLGPSSSRARIAADATLSATSVALHPRHRYGADAPDQIAFLVQTVSAVARVGGRRPQVIDACLWFVALQCVLSYTVSGWAKLSGPSWRTGEALVGVTRTVTFGDPVAWRLLDRHRGTARVLSVGVLAMECCFPAVLCSRRVARPLLGAATLFHLSLARIMGLDRFVWSFLSMHPALLYAVGPPERRDRLGRVTARRDDTLPRVCGGMLATILGCALLAQGRRRRAVLAGRGDEQMIATSAGNTLALRRLGPADADGPVIVLESGLLSTAEHWEWIARALAERFSTVIYSRAGYGPSRYGGGPFRLDDAVRDLEEIVDNVANGRRALLVGHSVGGYLALRAAAGLGDRLIGVALLDASYPADLQSSPGQAQARQALTDSLGFMPFSLSAGLGPLLKDPDWLGAIPGELRALALANYRDSRLWAAGQREWKATLSEPGTSDPRLNGIGIPVLVMTAELSASDDAAQREPWARRHVVAGADPDTVLTHAGATEAVAGLIAGFVSECHAS
jgi:pimeloyl-ACP methyl ester carboxylesterase